MPMRKVPDDWVIEMDEYHPDPKVAAKYADQNARTAAVTWLTAQINKLSALDDPRPWEKRLLESCRVNLAVVEAEIEELKEDE